MKFFTQLTQKKQVLEIVTCYTQLHPIRHCSRNIHEKYESSRMSTIWLPGNHGATAVQCTLGKSPQGTKGPL